MENSQEDNFFVERDYSYLKTPESVYQQEKKDSGQNTFVSNFMRNNSKSKLEDSGFTPNDKALQAIQFFKTAGYSEDQAIGITANLAIESGNFSDHVIKGKKRGDGGKAIGLAQWHPDRWNNVSTYLSSNNVDPFSFHGQLMGVDYELKNNEKKALKYLNNASNHMEAATIFNRKYERSADKSTKRESYADKLKKYYSTVGDTSIAQVGMITNPLLEDYDNFKVDLDGSLGVYGKDEGFMLEDQDMTALTDKASAISTPKKFLDEIDNKGSQLINTTKDVIDFVNDQKSNIAKGLSTSIDVVNNRLSDKREFEDLKEYYNNLNKNNYKRSLTKGKNDTILNY